LTSHRFISKVKDK
jgi:hypothetical protein